MEYVDLGLPSRTLWALYNESGYYNFDEAVAKFGDNLPTKADFEELLQHCWKRWNFERKVMELMGDNGAKLFLPAVGYVNILLSKKVLHFQENGCYWTITKYKDIFAYFMSIDENYAGLECNGLHYERSVRLVKRGGEK